MTMPRHPIFVAMFGNRGCARRNNLAIVLISCIFSSFLLHGCVGYQPASSLKINQSLPRASLSDAAKVKDALGYCPPNLIGVVAKSCNNDPVAIKVYPLGGGAKRRRSKAEAEFTPFPTLYWLCCPRLKVAIGELERQGTVKLLSARLEADPSSLAQMEACHADYARDRWSTLTDSDRELLLGEDRMQRFVGSLRDTGVAGIDWRKHGAFTVKCLHTHYAHFRAGSDQNAGTDERNIERKMSQNIIGQWVHEMLLESSFEHF